MEIRTLAEGEKITEPGFYAITLDRHHSQPCDGPSVTSGVLRQMELATPADVWAFSLLNPDRWEKEQTTALRLGRAMADYVEGGMKAVSRNFRVLPADKPNRPTDTQLRNYQDKGVGDLSKFCLIPDDMPRKPTAAQIKAYDEGKASDSAKESVEKWRFVEEDGRTPLKQSEADQIIALKKRVEFWERVDADPRDPLTDAEQKMIEDMGRVLSQDPGAGAAMGGIPEITMAWKDEETGLWLLSRPDTVNFDGTVTDYKKMNTQGRPFNYRVVDSRITEHGYDMQLAFGAEVYERLSGDWPSMAAIVAQWDKPPHHVILREIAEEDLRMGQFRNRRAIRRFAECLNSGHWPGPGEDVGIYHRPQWQREMLLEEMQIGGTAP